MAPSRSSRKKQDKFCFQTGSINKGPKRWNCAGVQLWHALKFEQQGGTVPNEVSGRDLVYATQGGVG